MTTLGDSKKVVALGEGVAAAAVGVPVDMQAQNNAFSGGMPVEAEIQREGTTGTAGIFGADRADMKYGDDTVTFVSVGDGALAIFDTLIPYEAFDNYNYIVRVNGVILEQGGGAGQFVISDQGGFARLTLGTAPEAGQEIEVYKVTPVEVLNGDADAIKKAQVRSYEFLWLTTTGATVSATSAYITHIAS